MNRQAWIFAAALGMVGCGGNGDDFGSGTGHIPDALVGKWSTSSVSGVNYTDGASFSDPSGVILQMTFLDGARYLFEFFDQASSYTCSTTVYGRETGTADFTDTQLTLAPGAATLTSKSSCSERFNYKKPWSNRLDGSKDYRWAVGADPNDPNRRMFVLVSSDGAELDLRGP